MAARRGSVISAPQVAIINEDAVQTAIQESQRRQAKIIQEIKNAHSVQMELLRTAISDEREQTADAHKVT